MLKELGFIFILLVLLFVPSVSYAQQETRYHEYVTVEFPVSNSQVANAHDYYIYALTTELSNSTNQAVANFLRLDAGYAYPGFNPFIHAGLYVTIEGVSWFAGGNPGDPWTPTVVCKLSKDHEAWIINDRPTGCLGNFGDLGLNVNVWTRLQLVTYGDGKWIVRFTNASGAKVEVAEIYNPNTTVTKAAVSVEETWYGTAPNQNPWLNAKFYDLDIKYRAAGGWTN